LDPIPVEVIKATVFIYSRDPSRFVEFEDIEIDEKRIMSFAKELKDSGMET